MAQRIENEETEFKVPESISLCINNCGVIGNPSTNNMCQNCFTASTATTSSTVGITGAGLTGTGIGPQSSRSVRSPKRSLPEESSTVVTDRSSLDKPMVSEAKRVVSRCSGCRRKVGLTGFRCRCGDLFCSEHRYSDRHDCSYDYKSAGREAIARENPVIRAAKIVKV
ncbi:zinc finger A20 and AN1 domain-containing stress-associated protein 5-like [Vicia villosa]|uniref:zinc finger A20 and AN1 domain-containing stress-associated protein 5-like n=1 Tax=Vicia villosa TaxID=3911 RepID=UPI00273BAF2D|nr:zinc finger A20 and AN1 domain-containing stress-associated protein 5-like [Vicia villosa]XP_058788505.1 zinc finger A20 and AN1 domain-containing stress-associated protein 5-like [Vicia villosa]